MTTRLGVLRRYGAMTAASVALVVVCLGAAPAAAQTAATQYQRTLAREKTARAAHAPSVATLRSIAKSYEAIVRTHPTSGYCDNALWQAAGVLEFAFAHGADAHDRDGAVHLLQRLKKEYPKSPIVRQADGRIAALSGGAAGKSAGGPASASNAGTTSKPAVAPASNADATSKAAAAAPAPNAGATSKAAAATSKPASAPPTSSGGTMTSRPLAPVDTPATTPARGLSASSVSSPSTTAPGAGRAPASSTPAATAPPAGTAAATPVPPASDANAAIIQHITHSPLPKGDRVTIELSREAQFTVSRASNPDRVVCDIFDASFTPAIAADAGRINGPLLQSVGIAIPNAAVTRLTFDLTAEPRYSSFRLYTPFRLVIDIESDAPLPPAPPPPHAAPTSSRANPSTPPLSAAATTAKSSVPALATVAAPSPAAAAPTGKGDYSLARQLGLGVSRIVIDPGHGGYDPGAQANGVTEAELVLDVSLRLEKLLAAVPGVDAVLTRRTDTFIPLEERTAIANREGADLFLSIHANASPQRSANGIETFFLNLATNAHAEAVAARENATSAASMGTLPQILKTIALNNKLAESRELATMVQASLVHRLSERKPAKDLGVKQAPFVVLIGAEMPSVLAEISFLSNPADATLLKQGAYRQRIAQALFDSLVKYQASLKKVATVASRAEER